MTDRRILVGVFLSGLLWTDAMALAADHASRRELRRMWRDAEEAAARADLDEAIGSYRRLALVVSGPERLEALYLASVLALNRVDGPIDREQVSRDLAEVAAAAGPRRWEAAALHAELDASLQASRLLAECSAARSAAASAWSSEREQLDAEVAAVRERASSVEAERDRSLRDARACHRELDDARSELARKEEALTKVRETLVTGGR
jgi:hypothetical protein